MVGDERGLWVGDTKSANTPNEKFRVNVSRLGVELVWFDPNPHSGHEGGSTVTLEEFLANADHQETVRTILGDAVLAEVMALVRRLLA